MGSWASAFNLRTICVGLLGILPSSDFPSTPSILRQFKRPPDHQQARTVSVTTSELTESSVDVSSDGRQLVFDLLGHLFTLPISGGKALQITFGPAWDAQPRFSPDGKFVAFVSDRDGSSNVWTLRLADNKIRAVTTSTGRTYADPIFANDGRSLVVSVATGNKGEFRIRSFDLPGSTGTLDERSGLAAGMSIGSWIESSCRVRSSSNRNSTIAQLHPALVGSRSLYYTVNPYWHRNFIARIDVCTRLSATDTLSHFRTMVVADAMRPIVDRNGRYLVYSRLVDSTVVMRCLDLKTSRDWALTPPTQVYNPKGILWLLDDLTPNAAFTPDGKSVVTLYQGRLWRVALRSRLMTPIHFTATALVELAPPAQFVHRIATDSIAAHQIHDPAFSPDGRYLAFSAFGHLYVKLLGGRIVRRLTTGSQAEYSPAWSPDGRYLAYTTWDDRHGGDIYQIRVDSDSHAQRLTQVSGWYAGLQYSSDGRRVLTSFDLRARAMQGGGKIYLHIPVDHGQFTNPTCVGWIPASGGPFHRIGCVETPPQGYNSARQNRIHETEDSSLVWYSHAIWYTDLMALSEFSESGMQRRLRLTAESASDIVVSPSGDDAVILAPQGGVYLLHHLRQIATADTVNLFAANSAAIALARLTRTPADYAGWLSNGLALFFSRGSILYTYSIVSGSWHVDTIRVSAMRDRPAGSIVFRDARLVTMEDDGIIDHGDLVVSEDRVVGVGRTGTVPIPPGAEIVEAAGLTILPGFVDVHAHVWDEWSADRTTTWQYPSYLSYGVTAIRDPQADARMLTYADEADCGEMLAPRIFTTGPAVALREGFTPEFDSELDALDILRYRSANGTEMVKWRMMVNSSDSPLASRSRQRALADAARALHLSPTSHQPDFRSSMTEILDGFAGHEHTYPVANLYADVTQLIAASGITYTQTLCVLHGCARFIDSAAIIADPRVSHFMPSGAAGGIMQIGRIRPDRPGLQLAAQQGSAVLRAGGRVAMGSHGEFGGLGSHWEMWAMAKGMSNFDVLRSATIMGARALGHEDDFGSLKVGKLADVVVLDGNPIEDIRNTIRTRFIMKNGRLYDPMSLAEVYPRHTSSPQFWWSSDNSRAAAAAVNRDSAAADH
jgi:dipeptidyl aminopeptidase/acylaminoacyl peptidase